MRARFQGGPAAGHTLVVHKPQIYIAMVDGQPHAYPEWPDEKLLNAAAGLWRLYVAIGDLDGETVAFVPA